MDNKPVENILPEDFDGIFRFTNWTKQDFSSKWGGIEYTFPAEKMTPIIISNATPLEIQSIRKKFARELAEREFYKSSKMESLEKQNPQHTVSSLGAAVTYNPKDLEPYIEKCLTDLPVGKATGRKVQKDPEANLHRDDEGKTVTRPLASGESLTKDGTPLAG